MGSIEKIRILSIVTAMIFMYAFWQSASFGYAVASVFLLFFAVLLDKTVSSE